MAIKHGDISSVKKLMNKTLAAKPLLKKKDSSECTPILLAIQFDQSEILEMLLGLFKVYSEKYSFIFIRVMDWILMNKMNW